MTLTLAQAITVAILAVSCFFCGWFFYRLRAKAREAELSRELLDTKGVIPQLESTVRSREQRVSVLCSEMGDWKNRHASMESSLKEKDREILARDRALRALNAELTLLKEAEAQRPPPDEAMRDAAAVATLEESLAQALSRCTELERSLEAARKNPSADHAPPPPVSDVATAADQPDPSANPTVDVQSAERIAGLEAELAARNADVSDLEARLKAEVQHGGEFDAVIEKLTTEIDRGKQELGKWRARVPKLVDSIREKEARLAESTQRGETLAQSLASAEGRSQALSGELDMLRATLAETTSKLDAQCAQSDAQRAQANELSRERDDLVRRLAAAETNLRDREGEVARSEAELERTQQAAREAQAEFSKKLATSIRLGREEVDRLNQENDRLTHELGAAITARNDSSEARSMLEELTRNRAAEIDELRAERDAAIAARTSLEEEHANLVERHAGTAEEGVRLERRVAELEGDLGEALGRLTRLDAAHAEKLAEHADLSAQAEQHDALVESLREELRGWHARLAPLESLLKQRDTTLAARTTRIEELQVQVTKLETELTERSQRASQRERELLAAQSAPKDPKSEYLETRVANQFEKNRELMAALEERNKAVAALEKDRDLKDKSLTVMRQQLEQERASTDRLAAQLRDLRTRVPDDRPDAPDDSVEPQMPKDLFTSAPQDRDDLQQIRGIGAAFEHRLNALGVYQFRQIAGFSDAELVWLENELRTFRGRVGRDDWVGQAVALMSPPPRSKALVLAQPQPF